MPYSRLVLLHVVGWVVLRHSHVRPARVSATVPGAAVAAKDAGAELCHRENVREDAADIPKEAEPGTVAATAAGLAGKGQLGSFPLNSFCGRDSLRQGFPDSCSLPRHPADIATALRRTRLAWPPASHRPSASVRADRKMLANLALRGGLAGVSMNVRSCG
jgi:hypothetical protein